MIARILPTGVVAVETRVDLVDAVLFPEEEAALGRAVEKRRREFTTARACAHQALQELGLPVRPIPSGAHGEPRWPAGVVGSITHCRGYRACAVARAGELLAIGIDAEPNEALPVGVLEEIALPEEIGWLRARIPGLPALSWDRLLFSAKESAYKTVFPLSGRRLGFEDAAIAFDPPRRAPVDGGREALAWSGAFSIRLLGSAPPPVGSSSMTMHGRWLAREDLLLTAIAHR